MKKILFLLALVISFVTLQAQPYDGGRLESTRFNVSIGVFSAGGVGDYQGAIGVAGSTGYTVDDIDVGDVLFDDRNIYRIEAVTPIVAGSSATIDVTFLQGTVGSLSSPISGKGFVVKPTTYLGLLLLTQNGSNFITEEQEAKVLTHNMMVVDSMFSLINGQGPDTSLQSFDLVIPENRLVTPNTVEGRQIFWNNLEQIFLGDSFLVQADTLELEGIATYVSATGKFYLKTPNVNNSASFNNFFLKLVDANTGEAEFDDIQKFIDENTDTDTIYYNNGTTTEQITRNDTIFATSGSSITRYDAGNGGYVVATGTGVTYAKTPGTGRFTIPLGVELLAYRVIGTSSDLNSGEISITIDYDASVAFNQNNATLYHPSILIQNRTQVLTSDPFLQRPDDAGDSIDIFDEIFTTAGEVTTKITGLSGDWGIKGEF